MNNEGGGMVAIRLTGTCMAREPGVCSTRKVRSRLGRTGPHNHVFWDACDQRAWHSMLDEGGWRDMATSDSVTICCMALGY